MAWFRALSGAGHVVPMACIHRLVGMGADQLLEELLGQHDEAIEDAWQEEFARLRDEIPALPGAADLARAMKERGATVVLATSGKPDDVEVLRRAPCGTPCLAVTCGGISRAELEEAGAAAVLRDPADLVANLDAVLTHSQLRW